MGESLSPVQLLAVPLMPILMTITVGIAWFFSALNFVFRDTERLLSVLFRLWMFVSPVFYSLAMVPARFRASTSSIRCASSSNAFAMFSSTTAYRLPRSSRGRLHGVVTATIGFVFFHIHEPRFARLN